MGITGTIVKEGAKAEKEGSKAADVAQDAGSVGAGIGQNAAGGDSIGKQVYDDTSAALSVIPFVGAGISAAMDIGEILHSHEPKDQKIVDSLTAFVGVLGPLGSAAQLGLQLFDSWMLGRQTQAHEKFFQDQLNDCKVLPNNKQDCSSGKCYDTGIPDGTFRPRVDNNAGKKDANGNCMFEDFSPPPDPRHGAEYHDAQYHANQASISSDATLRLDNAGSIGQAGRDAAQAKLEATLRRDDPYWDTHNWDGTEKPPNAKVMAAGMKWDPNYAKAVASFDPKSGTFQDKGTAPVKGKKDTYYGLNHLGYRLYNDGKGGFYNYHGTDNGDPPSNRDMAADVIKYYIQSTGLPIPNLDKFFDEQLYAMLTGAAVKPHKPTPAEMVKGMKKDKRYANVVSSFNGIAFKGSARISANAIADDYLVSIGVKAPDLDKVTDVQIYTFLTGKKAPPPPPPPPPTKRAAEDPAISKEAASKKNKSILLDPSMYDTNGHLASWVTRVDDMEKMGQIMIGMSNAMVGMSDNEANMAVTSAYGRW